MFFFKKKKIEEDLLKIHVKDIEEEFIVNKDIIINPLIEFLKKMSELEDNNSTVEEYEKVVKTICSTNLINKGYGKNKEKRYGYINKKCDIYFSMRKEDTASVEIYYKENHLEKKEKFVFRKNNDKYELDNIYIGFSNKAEWKMFHL